MYGLTQGLGEFLGARVDIPLLNNPLDDWKIDDLEANPKPIPEPSNPTC